MDIENLSYEELLDLNRSVVERLKQLDQANRFMQMLEFSRGDDVEFIATGGRHVFGRIVKLNKKTVSIVTPDGERWNVAPSFLSKTDKKESEKSIGNRVLPFDGLGA